MLLDKIKNKIINADCLEIMRQLPDKCIDVILTDPPYGINISNNIGRRKGDSKSNYKKITWDDTCPDKMVFDEIFRISKNQIIFGANHFIEQMPFNSSCWIVWDKLFSPEVSFATCELAWTSFKGVVKKYSLSSQQGTARIHPTQKPLKLFKQILNDYVLSCGGGGIICDPFSGSGTTAVACHDLKLDFVCIEKDEDYFKASCKRLQDAQAQLKLF